MNPEGKVLLLLCVGLTASYAVPTHYFDEIEGLSLSQKESVSEQERQVQTPSSTPSTNTSTPLAANATTTPRAPGTSPATSDNATSPTTTRPPGISPSPATTGHAMTQTTARPPTAAQPSPATTDNATTTTSRPPGVSPSPATTGHATTQTTARPPTATQPSPATTDNATTTTSRPPSTPRPSHVASGNCTLGDDILHILFNRTSMDVSGGMFTVEGSVGIVGSREDILNALMNNLRNHTRQEIEACLDLYRIPLERPVGVPDQSGSSHLIYNRPGHLGGLPSLGVPQPASDNFIYGPSYSTYIRPFNVAQRVPDFSPAHRYLSANSLQDLFQVLYTDFASTLDLYWQHGTPAYWFDRNAAPRPPPRG